MDPVQHFNDGRSLRDAGIKVVLQRNKEYLCAGLINLAAGGIFAWIGFASTYAPKLGSATVSFSIPRALFYILMSMGLTLTVIWKRKRARDIRNECVRAKLHDLAHLLRDRMAAADSAFVPRGNAIKSKAQASAGLDAWADFCNAIRDFFRFLIGDDSIECAIRLADKMTEDESSTDVVYATKGRSSGLSAARELTSEPIPVNKGLPCYFLQEKHRMGVLIYHDLDKAISYGNFAETRNEELFPKEIKTFMVAPINGWAGKDIRMIGLLYVTSRKDPFRQEDVDAMRMAADMLGVAVPRIVDALSKKEKKGKGKQG